MKALLFLLLAGIGGYFLYSCYFAKEEPAPAPKAPDPQLKEYQSFYAKMKKQVWPKAKYDRQALLALIPLLPADDADLSDMTHRYLYLWGTMNRDKQMTDTAKDGIREISAFLSDVAPCMYCGGRGQVSCPRCMGSGKCSKCGGDGFFYRSTMEKSGKYRKMDYDRSECPKECDLCGGSGKVNCEKCASGVEREYYIRNETCRKYLPEYAADIRKHCRARIKDLKGGAE